MGTFQKLVFGAVCIIAFSVILEVNSAPGMEDIGNFPLPPIPSNFSKFQELEQRVSRSGVKQMPCSTDILGFGKSFAKNGLRDSRYRWKDFNVYPDPSYSDNDVDYINYAMYRLSQALPCVNFGIWPRGSNPSGDYVHIVKKQGCWSHLGKRGGRQELSLQSPDCIHVGVVMHELIHALGFDHEHNRSDRDDYVTIHWENIQSGLAYAFEKVDDRYFTPFGVPYNERSIMHYHSTAFSKDNQSPTISSKRGVTVGMTGDLEASDIEKLRKMYNCN